MTDNKVPSDKAANTYRARIIKADTEDEEDEDSDTSSIDSLYGKKVASVVGKRGN